MCRHTELSLLSYRKSLRCEFLPRLRVLELADLLV